MVPCPLALALVLCEKVIVEEGTRSASFIGTFNHLDSGAFPFVPLPFCVVATLTGAQGEGEITLTVTQLDTDQEIYSLNRQVVFPDRFVEARVRFRLGDCAFPSPGVYMFTLTVDGDWVAHRRLQIRKTEVQP